jgi:hypothetical protein
LLLASSPAEDAVLIDEAEGDLFARGKSLGLIGMVISRLRNLVSAGRAVV